MSSNIQDILHELENDIGGEEQEFRPKTTRERLRIIIKAAVAIGLTAFVLWAWQSSIVRLSKNFYEVDPGKFYRSAQLSPTELKDVVDKYGIKTVISLRGAP